MTLSKQTYPSPSSSLFSNLSYKKMDNHIKTVNITNNNEFNEYCLDESLPHQYHFHALYLWAEEKQKIEINNSHVIHKSHVQNSKYKPYLRNSLSLWWLFILAGRESKFVEHFAPFYPLQY